MKAFKSTTGLVALLDRANVDTDQIIPKQYLKSIKRTGFGDNLFDGWRYLDEGFMGGTLNERQLNHQFVLNEPRYQGAGVLLTRENFGCGSSREHAVWAMMEYGFAAVIAPSFADIFYGNCFKNGLLPIVLEEKVINQLFAQVQSTPGAEFSVDLPSQTVRDAVGDTHHFVIDAGLKKKLLEGLDDIAVTLGHTADIRAFEEKHRLAMPWLFTEKLFTEKLFTEKHK